MKNGTICNKNSYIEALLMKKGVLKAVHDDDLETLIASLGMNDQFKEGSLKCLFCNSTITHDNLEAIIPKDNQVVFCCNNPKCTKQILFGGGIT